MSVNNGCCSHCSGGPEGGYPPASLLRKQFMLNPVHQVHVQDKKWSPHHAFQWKVTIEIHLYHSSGQL